MATTTRLPVVETPLWKLSIVPVLITTVAIVLISLSINPAIASPWDICSSPSSPYPEISGVPVIGIPCCTLSIFLTSTVATPSGQAFMSVFFSFITALITTTMAESQRQGEIPNAVVRHPAAPWLFVNIVSGAIAVPLVMASGSFITQEDACVNNNNPG
jgi:hypothetical protein